MLYYLLLYRFGKFFELNRFRFSLSLSLKSSILAKETSLNHHLSLHFHYVYTLNYVLNVLILTFEKVEERERKLASAQYSVPDGTYGHVPLVCGIGVGLRLVEL